jgi:hypothetical protein
VIASFDFMAFGCALVVYALVGGFVGQALDELVPSMSDRFRLAVAVAWPIAAVVGAPALATWLGTRLAAAFVRAIAPRPTSTVIQLVGDPYDTDPPRVRFARATRSTVPHVPRVRSPSSATTGVTSRWAS